MGKRFCGDCGAQLDVTASTAAAPHPTPPIAEPVSERRLCSVLFCDLVGFTARSEADDPEAVRELLTRYFETARTVIGRYGGTIEKFIGDAVMAVWGTPVATEEDAERAVRAALNLVEAVHELGAEVGADGLAARAGVVTGEVAVTIGATNEGMVAGDAVNTAARIQAVAAPGAVLVDGPTRRLTTSAITFQDEGEHLLKGKAEAERLWRATRVVSAIGGAQRVDGLEAPLIGRGVEMRMIRELFHASVERNQPRLVLCLDRLASARAGWVGSSRSTSTGSPISCCGIAAGASRMATGWCSGRSPRLFVGASRSPRRTIRMSPPTSLPAGSNDTCPIPPTEDSLGFASAACSAPASMVIPAAS